MSAANLARYLQRFFTDRLLNGDFDCHEIKRFQNVKR
jgi:hypothetical protein